MTDGNAGKELFQKLKYKPPVSLKTQSYKR